ncbi:MAG TPA: glycosyltransferase family 87 protein [Caulobacteraceae bacterium]|nr:glycosyltransferase family 87 protein [Caulobacteraceae bacterium]
MRPTAGFPSDNLQRAALTAAAFVAGYALSAWRIGHGAPDFYVFWTAGRHWRTPYDPSVVAHLLAQLRLHGVWPFAYPPTFLLVAWPFAQLPLRLAYPLWTGLEMSLFLLAASYFVRPVWTTALLALTPVVFFAAMLGQTSLLTGAAMLAAWRFRDARPALAGVLLGVAGCIKPQALILAPVVFWGRWRLLGCMAVTGVVMALASLGFGWRRWPEWLHAMTAFQALVPMTDRINPSALMPGIGWSFAVGALGLWLAASSRDLVGLVAGALCVAPYAHAYDLAALTPLALGWLIEWRRAGWARALTGGALLSGLIATPLAALGLCAAVAALPAMERWRRVPRPGAGLGVEAGTP